MVEAAHVNIRNIINCHFEGMMVMLFNYIKKSSLSVSDLLSQFASHSRSSSNQDEDNMQESADDDFDEFDNPINEERNKKYKSVEYALEIMIDIVVEDLKQSPDHSKTFFFLKSFDSASDDNGPDCNFMQYMVIIQLLNRFCKEPKLQEENGDGSILTNLNQIISNLDELIPTNPFTVLKSIKLINSMAFKNNMEVRMQMKNLKMLELRDQMIVTHLTNVSELLILASHKEVKQVDAAKYLIKSVSDFSYDVVAVKPKFREHHCIEIIALTLLFFVQTHDPCLPMHLSEQESQQVQEALFSIVFCEILQYSQNE